MSDDLFKPLDTVAEISELATEIVKLQTVVEEDRFDDELEEVVSLPAQVDDLVSLLYKVKSMKRAVQQIETKVKNSLSEKMQGKAKKLDNQIIIGKGTQTYKPYNVDKVLEYLGDDWKIAVRPSFRTTAIKKIAEERGDNPYVIFDSLFETVITGDVSIVPESKAPKKYAILDDGEEMNI